MIHRGTRRRWLVVAVASAAAAALGVRGPAAGSAPVATDLRAEALQLAQANSLRQKELDLAAGESFYLLLDPSAGRLQLLLKGAVLRDFKLLRLEVGFPEVGYKVRRPEDEWQGTIFARGELDPPRGQDRFVIMAPPPSPEDKEPPPLPAPLTPEEKYPVPSRYHIRFDGGVSIEVRTDEADPNQGFWARTRNRLGHWLRDARAALGRGSPDSVRVRLVLSPQEARSLYRALPPAAKLLVLPRA